MLFEQVRPQIDFPELEDEILGLWNRIGAFEKSVEQRPEDKPFVFYEGPPTANGRPGFHHALARAFRPCRATGSSARAAGIATASP